MNNINICKNISKFISILLIGIFLFNIVTANVLYSHAKNVNNDDPILQKVITDALHTFDAQQEKEELENKPSNKVSISMCGDNLTHIAVLFAGALNCKENKNVNYNLVGANGHKYLTGDVKFDFSKLYKKLIPTLQSTDINLINIETLCAGPKYNYKTFPSFNAPYNLIDNVHAAGFNVFLHANNHCLDSGVEGLESALKYERQNCPNAITTGAYLSSDEFNQNTIIEKNGIKIAIVNYTYGYNGSKLPKNKAYMGSIWSNDLEGQVIEGRVRTAREKADFVIVCPHWGVEYNHIPNGLQKKQAALLSAWGADVILGAHPHVMQPDEWINNTYCVYSVGNLLWTSLSTVEDNRQLTLGLMPRLEISKKEDGKTTIDKIEINPVLTHEGRKEDVYVSRLDDYTEEEARNNAFCFAYKTYTIKDLWDVFYQFYDSVERKIPYKK